MANQWIASIDISKEWKSTQEDPNNLKNLCETIILKLTNIPKKLHDEHLEYIIENFKAFNPNTQDVNDFDVLMSELYDWGDTGKRLWVNTFPEIKRNVSTA